MRHYTLTVRGHSKEWTFDVAGTPEYVAQWREDGLVIDEVVNEIPHWAVTLGLNQLWRAVQDWLGIYG